MLRGAGMTLVLMNSTDRGHNGISGALDRLLIGGVRPYRLRTRNPGCPRFSECKALKCMQGCVSCQHRWASLSYAQEYIESSYALFWSICDLEDGDKGSGNGDLHCSVNMKPLTVHPRILKVIESLNKDKVLKNIIGVVEAYIKVIKLVSDEIEKVRLRRH